MGSSIGASRTVWAVLGVHSAESVPFAGRFAVRDLVDGLCLRRGSREDKHGKVAQHTIAVVATWQFSPDGRDKTSAGTMLFSSKFGQV